MEKKNILLVIASVTLFLIVVLVAGLWLFWPQRTGAPQKAAATVQPIAGEAFDTFEYYKGREQPPDLLPPTPPKEAPLVLRVGEAPEQQPVVTVQPRAAAPTPPQTPASAAATTSPPPTAAPQPKPAAARPASAQRPSAPAARAEYWIQAGSYRNRDSAENLSRRLAEHGLAGTITTREIGGQTYFRVRIGPYATSQEAEQFLATVRAVEGLGSSYVSRVTRTAN